MKYSFALDSGFTIKINFSWNFSSCSWNFSELQPTKSEHLNNTRDTFCDPTKSLAQTPTYPDQRCHGTNGTSAHMLAHETSRSQICGSKKRYSYMLIRCTKCLVMRILNLRVSSKRKHFTSIDNGV